jgi:hypothetical protein
MNGVTMKAWHDRHYVNLDELLRVVEPFIVGFTWKSRIEEVAPGPSAQRLEQLDPEQRLPTVELLRLFSPDAQVIDGEFLGYSAIEQKSSTLVLRAVDSTWWDIESENEELLALIRRTYPDARPIPQ